KIALFERSEFAILEGRDLESINFWNEIFGQELFSWLRLGQISARNFDKSARRFLLVKNLCSFILTTKPEK
ncbi:hypothetical protein, partial [Peptoniphilus harei]|uniref:hypothetical protein n=1 Tax=Peptoniphilus harei TaxID=54005 RepID=UPI0029084CE2